MLDPTLVATVIFVESGGNPNAISKSGAVGLMQIMPRDGIAANQICINGPCFADRPSIEELKDPAFNINWGSNYLSGLVKRYGERDGLFRYGPMDVGHWYADLVLDLYYRVKNN